MLSQLKRETFDFEQRGGPKRWTPLHVASYTGSFDVIDELIEKANVDVFSRSLNNKVPRQVARNGIVAKVLRIAERKVVQKQMGVIAKSRVSLISTHNELNYKLLIAQQKDFSRHNYRVTEDALLHQQLMD